MKEYRYYIGGEFKESKEKIDVSNPFTEEVFARVYEASPADISAALVAAGAAQKQWRRFSFKERAPILREIGKAMTDNLAELADLESRQIGKTLKESLFVDVPLGAQCFDYYASFLETLREESFQSELGIDYVSYSPFGTVIVFLPYNVPLMIFGFTCAAALAAGNALVIKPSEYGSLSLLELATAIDKLDIPRGLINIISGKGGTVGKFLSESRADVISFTGLLDTLKKVISQSARDPKKIICELGGCNVSAVFADADFESAGQNLLAASFMKQGQMCIGTSLLLVEGKIYDRFVKSFVERAEKIKIGDPFLPDTGLGPLVTKEHLADLNRKVNALVNQGAKILCGGRPLERKGYFYPPTVIEVDKVIYEEFFAPVVLIKRFDDKKEVFNVLENNSTGLVAQVWTKDLALSDSFVKEASCGTVWVNTFAQMSSQTPFGGTGRSGWGRSLGKSGFFEYIQTKHIGIGAKQSPVFGWFGV